MMPCYRSSNILAVLLLLTNLISLPSSLARLSTQTVTDWCMDYDNQGAADFFDYIVVGAGNGGGLVASRLAEAGFKTLLLDAGPDYGEEPVVTNPSLAAASTEDPNVEWATRVKFSDDPGRDSVLYPRASMLGGCVSHNAMIGQYSFPDTWEELRVLTGDDEFAEDKMRDRFKRIEKNEYVKEGSKGSAGHGFDGFLSTSYVIDLLSTIFQPPFGVGDVNAPGSNKEEGLYAIPLTVSESNGFTRSSVYKLIKDTMTATDTKLTVRTDSFVTKVLLQPSSVGGEDPVAYGVQVQEGKALYEASTGTKVEGAMRTYYARKEIIVAGGTFNTPQILILSGIGPMSELSRLGIPMLVDSPGVGSNLRDKLESTVNYQIIPTVGSSFSDHVHANQQSSGPAGSVLGIQTKSDPELAAPDIHINLFPTDLRGMNDGWVDTLRESAGRVFTFNIITAPRSSRTGNVTVQSTDPLQVVKIDFNGYDDEDLARSAVAIRMVRNWVKTIPLAGLIFYNEDAPGRQVKSDEDIKAYVSEFGWGHHAIGTAKMGADSDSMAVVDGQFKVRGVQNLRVADASVFPNHPGFYVMIPLYMMAEKAAEDFIKGNVTIDPASLACS